MIEVIIFSKGGVDCLLFKYSHYGDLPIIMSLEGKTLQDLEQRDGFVIAQLEAK